MRTMKSSAAAFSAGLATTLTILFSSPAGAANVCVRDGPTTQPLPISEQLFDQMEGFYKLSNGQRLKLQGDGQRLWADFGRRREVPLERVGENSFVSRDGSVNLSYRPDADEIAVRYPADQYGHYVKAC